MRRQAPVSDEPNLSQARLEMSEAEPGDFDRACPDAGQERSATASTPSLQLQDTHISAERKKKHTACANRLLASSRTAGLPDGTYYIGFLHHASPFALQLEPHLYLPPKAAGAMAEIKDLLGVLFSLLRELCCGPCPHFLCLLTAAKRHNLYRCTANAQGLQTARGTSPHGVC